MTPGKRAFDILGALVLGLVLGPVILAVALAILLTAGRPVFYISERMVTPTRGFRLWKFRTMAPVAGDVGVSGGHKMDRITPVGAVLRRYRLDELPQLWNILRGDMSFVGPRPPLRRYVEMFPELYAEVLRARPGVTGLATLVYHRTEERLLSDTADATETERIYVRRCVPRKAALDRIYLGRRSFCWDVQIMLATVARSVPPGGRRRSGGHSAKI